MRLSLLFRRAETREGRAVLVEAAMLSCCAEYRHLSDAELIRLAYWGVSGAEDLAGRPNHG